MMLLFAKYPPGGLEGRFFVRHWFKHNGDALRSAIHG